MTRRLFFLLIIVLNTLYLQAQYRIINKNKSWNVLKSYKEQKTISYKFLNDTVINGKIYSSLYYSFSDRLDSTDLNFAGYVREDTLKGNVYLRFMTGEEFVIYNFNVLPCDIINLPSYNLATKIYFEVDFIDSVKINGENKKRLYLTSLDNSVAKDQIWIEGIGSVVGLIETGEVQYGRYWSKLLCVKNNDQLIWSNRKGICYIISASNANKIAIKRNKRKKTRAKIISCDFELKNLTVKVINLKGKIVKQQIMKTRKDQTVYKIGKGEYLVQVVDRFNKIYLTKKIKIN